MCAFPAQAWSRGATADTAATVVDRAVCDVLGAGSIRTPELGGTATTTELGTAIARRAAELTTGSAALTGSLTTPLHAEPRRA